MNHISVGKIGEQLTKDYLTKKHYKILFCNYHLNHLELDIVAKKQNILYFVEVKSRHYQKYKFEKNLNILPEEEFSCAKKQKFIKASELFLIKNYQFRNLQTQLMLIAIYLFDDHEPIYKIYENVLENI